MESGLLYIEKKKICICISHNYSLGISVLLLVQLREKNCRLSQYFIITRKKKKILYPSKAKKKKITEMSLFLRKNNISPISLSKSGSKFHPQVMIMNSLIYRFVLWLKQRIAFKHLKGNPYNKHMAVQKKIK